MIDLTEHETEVLKAVLKRLLSSSDKMPLPVLVSVSNHKSNVNAKKMNATHVRSMEILTNELGSGFAMKVK